jgi:hypothetical protein
MNSTVGTALVICSSIRLKIRLYGSRKGMLGLNKYVAKSVYIFNDAFVEAPKISVTVSTEIARMRLLYIQACSIYRLGACRTRTPPGRGKLRVRVYLLS